MPVSDRDYRALGAGVLVSASMCGLALLATGEVTASELMTLLVTAVLVVAVPVGILVGYLSRSYRGQFLEGGFAAAGGTLLGIFAWATLEAARLSGATLADRLDVVFVVMSTVTLPALAALPFHFLVGGYLAGRVARWRANTGERNIDDELEVGLFGR